MKMRVHFDTDGETLSKEEATIDGIVPYQIDRGVVCFYEMNADNEDNFIDCLDTYHWCYFSAYALSVDGAA